MTSLISTWNTNVQSMPKAKAQPTAAPMQMIVRAVRPPMTLG